MSDDTRGLPADVAARVLRRAAEMTPAVHLPDSTVSEDVLLEAAAEVGISPDAVRRAVAIEKLGGTPDVSLGDRVAGPAVVSADAETSMSVDDTLRALDAWLARAHLLRRERAHVDGGEWRKRRDTAAKVQRTLRGLNGGAGLSDADRVTARAVAVTDSRTIVRISVDRHGSRSAHLAAGAVVGSVGTLGAAVFAVVATPIAAVAAPVAAVGGVAIARLGRRQADHTGSELARLADDITHGATPRSVADDVLDVLGTRRRRRR